MTVPTTPSPISAATRSSFGGVARDEDDAGAEAGQALGGGEAEAGGGAGDDDGAAGDVGEVGVVPRGLALLVAQPAPADGVLGGGLGIDAVGGLGVHCGHDGSWYGVRAGRTATPGGAATTKGIEFTTLAPTA